MLIKTGDGDASRDQESVQIADSPTRRYGESATPQLADAGSRRPPDSPIRGVDFRLRISPRIRSQNLLLLLLLTAKKKHIKA
jgi:hypothetical protein